MPPVEPERETGLVRERFGVETIAEYAEVMKVAMWAAAAHPEDIDRSIPLREQGFKAILAEFRASLEPEYQEAMKVQAEAEEETARVASNRHVEWEPEIEAERQMERHMTGVNKPSDAHDIEGEYEPIEEPGFENRHQR